MTPHEPRRVLVVDDYVDSAIFIASYVGHMGYETRFAVCGEEALELSTSFRPHVAIVDLDLPDLHGCEVGRVLRTRCDALFLIALTGSVMPGYRGRAIEAGFDQFLLKPLVLTTLMPLLTANAVSLRRSRRPPPPRSSSEGV
ncbi:MAG: response regulator [Myxococcota bacterium]|nr:response regulator [Myxococcota bacterium]